jgi:hypothetical protein
VTNPSDIEREIEAARDRLANTIDQLVYRSSPKTVVGREVAAVKAHYVDVNGQPRTDNILKTVGGVVGVIAAFMVIRKIVR